MKQQTKDDEVNTESIELSRRESRLILSGHNGLPISPNKHRIKVEEDPENFD